jgi:hypothetical protein
MKPSDIGQPTGSAAEGLGDLPYPRSSLAEPPIATDEARAADIAICRYHKGLITQTGDQDGRVFFCPIGREYWRYTKQVSGMFKPLNYPHRRYD